MNHIFETVLISLLCIIISSIHVARGAVLTKSQFQNAISGDCSFKKIYLQIMMKGILYTIIALILLLSLFNQVRLFILIFVIPMIILSFWNILHAWRLNLWNKNNNELSEKII